MSRIKIEDIQKQVAEQSWKLISNEYVNLDSILEFECKEGHKVYLPWKKARQSLECPICKENCLNNLNLEMIPKATKTRRILALDQASYKTGYAIFDDKHLIKRGVFAVDLNDEIARCSIIKQWLISAINNWQPDYIVFEGIQLQNESNQQQIMGVTVFQTLARLQGILMETAYNLKIPFEVCPSATWRNFCGVKGRTRTDRKRSMQLKVKEWYDITVTDDESDAIGIGRYAANANTITENWEN